jgi:16S rRNA (cytosine967-C5)-methyltransferase
MNRQIPAVHSSSRIAAVQMLQRVIVQGESLSAIEADMAGAASQPLTKALCYGVLRRYQRLEKLAALLLDSPLRPRDMDVQLLLLTGLYQLEDLREPEYAVVSSTVDAAAALGKVWGKGVLNAVLRRFIREREQLIPILEQDPSALYAAPLWLIRRLQADWPNHWQMLLQAANVQAPMFLRVDLASCSRDSYLENLRQHGVAAEPVRSVTTAVRLIKACDVAQLPGFDVGAASVQDAAAQWAAMLLDAQAGERVLDACAAPGGKTLHLLQHQPQLAELIAVDIQAQRLERVRSNLQRARLEAKVDLRTADVAVPEQWWDGRQFDRILLDAPCTASGVIRRHPDIKLLRREQDIESLAAQQQNILTALWPMLAAGGRLLYCTCSLFRDENERQIRSFLQANADAECLGLTLPGAVDCGVGVQLLGGPNNDDTDGFFYAALRKKPGAI